jgi:hypothetical protein
MLFSLKFGEWRRGRERRRGEGRGERGEGRMGGRELTGHISSVQNPTQSFIIEFSASTLEAAV